MTPAEQAVCRAALEAAEKAAEALRAVLGAEGTEEVGSEAGALRIKDVVAEFGWSEKTARRWAKRCGFKRGGVLFVRRDALQRGSR